MSTFTLLSPQRSQPVAVGDGGAKTALELLALARAVAKALPPSSQTKQVAVVCQDRFHFAGAVCGVWMAGHVVALLPNDRPALVAQVQAAHTLLAVVGDGQVAATIDVATLPLAQPKEEELCFEGTRVAACIYSSGSTGAPVAYDKTFAQLLGEAQVLAGLFSLGEDGVLPTVPCQHIYGFLMGVLAPLFAGAAFVRQTPLHTTHIMQTLTQTHATVLVASPAHLKGLAILCADGPVSLPRLRQIVSSGAPLPPHDAQALSKGMGVDVTELFGSTETGGIGYRRPPASAWQPLPGVSVATAAGLGMDHLPAERLLVRSPHACGAEEGWFITQDMIALADDGSFVHLGRSDSVVKVGGRRVDLEALRQALLRVPGVADAAVVGLSAPPPRDLEIGAIVVAPVVTLQSMRAALLQTFDPVALPRRWRFVEALPHSTSGKLPRAQLVSLFTPHPEASSRIGCETRSCTYDEPTGTHHISIFVPEHAWFFGGHFDHNPLVPAVVQVNDLALAHAHHLHTDLPPLRQASRLKFKHPIRPGDLVQLTLCRKGSQVVFAMRVGGVDCSGGVLEFAEAGA
ncbi:MAG: AMP-binding protein [Deltaproteobacteria bacterium]|nr:AMP-binding protein [Deltaproteobacteria bacterium]